MLKVVFSLNETFLMEGEFDYLWEIFNEFLLCWEKGAREDVALTFEGVNGLNGWRKNQGAQRDFLGIRRQSE